MRHNPNMYSQALEVAKQAVAGPIASRPAVDRTSFLEDIPFDCQIGIQIDLGGLDGLSTSFIDRFFPFLISSFSLLY